MPLKDQSEELSRLRDAVDGYQDSVLFLVALQHELRFDEKKKVLRTDVEHQHGSRHKLYKRDASGAEIEDGEVTPDFALLARPDFVVLGEVKRNLPAEGSHEDLFSQLTRYDRAAARAKGEHALNEAGTVLLTRNKHRPIATELFEAATKDGRFSPTVPFAVIGAMRTADSEPMIALEKGFGSVVPASKDAKFKRIVQIRLQFIAGTGAAAIAFYDATPPLCYLLTVIWDKVLPTFFPTEDVAATSRTRAIEVDAAAVGERLRSQFSLKLLSPLLPGAPKQGAVKKAFEELCRAGLATPRAEGRYLVQYRRLRGGAFDYFLNREAKALSPKKEKKKKAEGLQIPMFEGLSRRR